MYGILNEELLSAIKITGKVLKNKEQKEPEKNAKITLLDVNGYIKGKEITNQDGEFSFNIQNIDSGKIKLVITTTDGNNGSQEFDISKQETNLGDIYMSDIIEIKSLPGGGSIKITNTNISIKLETDKENDFYFTVSPKDDETIFFKKRINKNTPINLNILKTGQLLNDLPTEFKVEKVNEFFDSKGDPNLIKTITIKVFDEKNKLNYQNDFDIRIPNSSINVIKSTNEDGDVFYSKKDDNVKLMSDKENNINIILATLYIKVVDENKQPLNGVTIVDSKTNKEYNTNENGVVFIGNVKKDDIFNFEFKKEGYKKSTLDVSEFKYGVNNVNMTLTSKIGFTEITGEPEDNYKDTLFTIYGRGKTKNTYNECIIMAKNNILNKFVQKYKSKYTNVPLFKKEDIDLKYEMVYRRPSEIVKKMQGENSVIIKSKRNDVRLALRAFINDNNIKVSSEPFEYENLTIDEALNSSYSNNKTVLVVVGSTTNDETKELNNLLQEDFSDKINKNYVPIFVNVDPNNSNYKKLRTYVKFDSYPRVIYLRRNDKGNVEVVKNLGYYEIKDDISKL